MPDYDVHEHKAAIKEVLEACAPLSVVFDWWVFGDDEKKWPTLLKSPNDLDSNNRERTHGFVVEFEAAMPPTEQRLGGYDSEHWRFRIVGLHYHLVEAAEHSSKLCLTELMEISKVFRRDPTATIALPAPLANVSKFEFVHGVAPFGAEMCHGYRAFVTLRPC